MKVLFLLLILGSQMLPGYSAFASIWSNSVCRASTTRLGSTMFSLRYPVLSWEKLLPRRSAVSEAIADIGVIAKYQTSDPYANRVTDEDVGARLYTILENIVAVHSGLPRIGKNIDIPEGSEAGMNVGTLRDLEDTFVLRRVWEQYLGWGLEMRRDLEEALNSLPDSLSLGESDRESLFEFIADEFDRNGDRELYSLPKGGQHGAGSESYVVKKDLPAIYETPIALQPPKLEPWQVKYLDRWPLSRHRWPLSPEGYLETLKPKQSP